MRSNLTSSGKRESRQLIYRILYQGLNFQPLFIEPFVITVITQTLRSTDIKHLERFGHLPYSANTHSVVPAPLQKHGNTQSSAADVGFALEATPIEVLGHLEKVHIHTPWACSLQVQGVGNSTLLASRFSLTSPSS